MEQFTRTVFCYSVIFSFQVSLYLGDTQDQTSPRANTLLDDADDIQRQLENEARDRFKYGRPKTIWVFHLPTQSYPFLSPTEPVRIYEDNHLRKRFLKKHKTPATTTAVTKVGIPLGTQSTQKPNKHWEYKDQSNWTSMYPSCGGRSQSPVNVPTKGLIKVNARKVLFINYDALPTAMTLQNDGSRVILMGDWKKNQRPLVYGGAAYSRRYLFHSLVVHWPSEHWVGGLQYPIESQVLHISAEYNNFNDAVKASSSDPLAFLGIVNIYRFGNLTHPGIEQLLKSAASMRPGNLTMEPKPLSFYSPPFKKYACYQGSLTFPPCTESVLWFVRGKALLVDRDKFNVPYGLCNTLGEPDVKPFRLVNPLNDRLVYFFQ